MTRAILSAGRFEVCVVGLVALSCLAPPRAQAQAVSEPLARLGPDAEFERIARGAPGFGGMYYDQNGRLNVWLTPSAHATPAASQAVLTRVGASLVAQGRQAPAASEIVIREGARDFVELLALHDRLWSITDEPGVVFTDVDETQNKVVIGVLAGASTSVEAAVERLGLPADAVALVDTPPIVPLTADTLEDFVKPTGGGLQISFVQEPYLLICTLGFNVWRGNTDRSQAYFFTNSHCTWDEGVVTGVRYWMPLPPPHASSATLVGTEVEDPDYFTSPCFTGFECRWSDAALVRYESGIPANVGAVYHTTSFGTGPSAGSIEIDAAQPRWSVVSERSWSYVGETVDKVGRTTGWTRGPVTRNCVNVIRSFAPPRALLCQAFVSASVNFGDSGSPVFQPIGSSGNVRLHGILWGGPASPSPTNYFFVYSIMDALREDFDGPDCRLTGPNLTVRCPADRAFVTR